MIFSAAVNIDFNVILGSKTGSKLRFSSFLGVFSGLRLHMIQDDRFLASWEHFHDCGLRPKVAQHVSFGPPLWPVQAASDNAPGRKEDRKGREE